MCRGWYTRDLNWSDGEPNYESLGSYLADKPEDGLDFMARLHAYLICEVVNKIIYITL